MEKYEHLRRIMTRAWVFFRKGGVDFAEALRRAWRVFKAEPENRERIEAARIAAGIEEESHTWYGWKLKGFEVRHGSKCLFQALLLDPAKGAGKTAVKSYFGRSQVELATA